MPQDLGLTSGSTADQSPRLQTLIDEAASRRAPLQLPPGTFRTGPLQLRSGTRLIGAHGLTTLEYLGGGAFLTGEDCNDVLIDSLVLDAAGLALDAARTPAAVALVNASRIEMRGLTITHSLLDGLSLKRCSGRITGSTIANISQAALTSHDAQGLEISHNTISDCANNGILVWRETPGEDGTIVTANRVTRIGAKSGGSGQYGNGVNVFRAAGVLVTGNRISDCAYSAIRGNAASNIQMVANSCTRIGEVALYAEFAFEGAVIASNLVDAAASGISVTNFNEGGRLAVVQGNLIRNLARREHEPVDKRGDGISVEADAVVSGNVVENAASFGIAAGWGRFQRDITVSQNLVRGAQIGIVVSADAQSGKTLVAQNHISSARDGAIRLIDATGTPQGNDLVVSTTEPPAHIVLSGNIAT